MPIVETITVAPVRGQQRFVDLAHDCVWTFTCCGSHNPEIWKDPENPLVLTPSGLVGYQPTCEACVETVKSLREHMTRTLTTDARVVIVDSGVVVLPIG